MPNGDEQLWKPRSNPSSLHARMQDHRVTLSTRDVKTVKDAFMSGQRSRPVLNPAAKIISSATRQILDCLNTLLAECHEHQRGETGNAFEFVCNKKLFSPGFEFSLDLLCQMSVRIGRRGSGFDGIGQTCCLVFDVAPCRLIAI
jgi:hypothetical protein